MELRQLPALALKAAAVFGGAMPLAVVLFVRRYDVLTMVTRLRRLHVHDPDAVWLLVVSALVAGFIASMRSAWSAARRMLTSRDSNGSWRMAWSLVSALAVLFMLNAVLDAYGWQVQL